MMKENEKYVKFGFKSRRKVKEKEILKHEFPYIEILPAVKKGSVTKFRLLNNADKLLKLTNLKNQKISYFQSEDDSFCLANTSNINTIVEIKVNKDSSFNSKFLYLRMCKDLELERTEILTFKIVETVQKGFEEFTTVQLIEIEKNVKKDTEEIIISPEEHKENDEELKTIID